MLDATKPNKWGRQFFTLLLLGQLMSSCNFGLNQQDLGVDRFQVHFRPLKKEQNWLPKLIDGQAIIGSIQQTSFGFQFEVLTAKRSDLTLRFVADSQNHSFDYHLANTTGDLFLYEVSPKIFSKAPPVLPEGKEIVVYLHSSDQDYHNWGLHLWDESGLDWTSWNRPLLFGPTDYLQLFGAVAKLPLPSSPLYSATPPAYSDFPEKIGMLIHRGQEKGSEHHQYLFPDRLGQLYFVQRGRPEVFCSPDLIPCPSLALVTGAAAHWIKQNQLVWDVPIQPDLDYQLVYSPHADILKGDQLNQASVVSRQPLVLRDRTYQEAEFPHLLGLSLFHVDINAIELDAAIRSQIYAIAIDRSSGHPIHVTRVQLPGVLDEKYSYHEELGLVLVDEKPELRVWAPTARKVHLQIYGHDFSLQVSVPMQRNQQGVWTFNAPQRWLNERLYYRYKVQVYHYLSDRIENYEITDPYSNSLSANSVFSQMVNLNDRDLKPAGWDEMQKPTLAHPSDISILEVHIRDYSSNDLSVPEQLRGTYLAFSTAPEGNEDELTLGQRYLQSLQEAGLTHVQILPANDFATIREKRSERVELTDSFQKLCQNEIAPAWLCEKFGSESIESVFNRLPKDTGAVQEIERYLRPIDGFNWGYDPLHYGVPEGSYATEADGVDRILEFREMVKALTELGLLISLDVVFNHTFASGTYPEAVLDRIVPGYYHRRHPSTGRVETTTCCANTASEHFMMEKLMIDSLKRWHQEYRIDAFRFDLMGHHMKGNLIKIQHELGPDVYLYGEGWDFGEVAGGQRGLNATQIHLSGSGIGTFNDRFRDAIRGGSPFDCGFQLAQQGYGNGLYVNPNASGGLLESTVNFPDCTKSSHFTALAPDKLMAEYQRTMDRVQVGLAASLKNYALRTSNGQIQRAGAIFHNGQPLAYTREPYETINYISKHDNQTLWDINQLKLPDHLSHADRRQAQEFAISLTLLAQGIPFFQLGVDLLRSKSLSRDSYNSGDWFNRVDYTGAIHNWNIGLPREDKDGANWAFFREIIKVLPDSPSQDLIRLMQERFRLWLRVRYSTPLFRLRDARAVQDRLQFINLTPEQATPTGIIAMKISDEPCRFDQVLDHRWNDLVVIFNPRPDPVMVHAAGYQAHELLDKLLRRDGDFYWLGGSATGVWMRRQQGPCKTDQPIRLALSIDD